MRLKRVILLTAVFIVLGTLTVIASESYERYRAKKVNVFVNGQEAGSQGLLVQMGNEAKTMLPLRDIASALQAIVEWDEDTGTVNIYKPNVHIFLSTPNQDGSFGTFGTVYYRQKHQFNLFAQIDGLTTPIRALKYEIVDPKGESIYNHELEFDRVTSSTEWLKTPLINHEFKHLGEYKARVYMQIEKDKPYDLVAEKGFHSIEKK